ncbi:hypothetical protein SDJN03_19404, partial [Cucurbita argyrosperma subsp. sororia]
MAAAPSMGLKANISSLPPRRGRIKARIFESLVNSAALILLKVIRYLVSSAQIRAVPLPSPVAPPPPPLRYDGGSVVT